MHITLGHEDYQTLSRCLLGLHTYFFTLHYRFPETVAEERLLCMMLVLQTVCDKIFAYQPVQESVSYTIKANLQRYFRLKDQAQLPTEQAAAWFEQALGASPLVRQFVQNGAVADLSAYLDKTLRRNALEALRAGLPQTGKPLRKCSLKEIAARQARLMPADCAACWAQYGPRTDATANRLKNALVTGKYLVGLADAQLIAVLTDPSLYPALDSNAKRACADMIAAVFPLMNDAQKQQIEHLATGVMAEYRHKLLVLRSHCHEGQYNLMDLFRISHNVQFKQGLLDFGQALVRDKGICFYVQYDVADVSWSELEDFAQAVNGLADLLHRDFLQHPDVSGYDLWKKDTFKIIWLISVIWFRKLFHELQTSSRAGV